MTAWFEVSSAGVGPRKDMVLRLRSYCVALTVQASGRSASFGVVSHAWVWQPAAALGATSLQAVRPSAPAAITRAMTAITLAVRAGSASGWRGGRGRDATGSGRGGRWLVIAAKHALPGATLRGTT